jgi:hypothetical protein
MDAVTFGSLKDLSVALDIEVTGAGSPFVPKVA